MTRLAVLIDADKGRLDAAEEPTPLSTNVTTAPRSWATSRQQAYLEVKEQHGGRMGRRCTCLRGCGTAEERVFEDRFRPEADVDPRHPTQHYAPSTSDT